MREHADLLDGYEVFPGRKPPKTGAAERYDIAEGWTDEMAEARLRYMGLPGPRRSSRLPHPATVHPLPPAPRPLPLRDHQRPGPRV